MSRTLDAATVADLAERLDAAERTHVQAPRFSAAFPWMTLDDACVVQRAWTDRKIAAGHRPIGHKIGQTSRVMQRSCAYGPMGAASVRVT